MGRHRNCMDLTLLTCNYNTPELILNLLKSVQVKCSKLPNVVVMNTSTTSSTELLDINNIPYYNCRGFSHGEAVNLGFTKIKTRYALLVDSDILFLDDYIKPFEKFKSLDLTLMGKIADECIEKKLYPRIEPWYCFIDLYKLKHFKIKFFDRPRNIKDGKDVIYDVGSTMYEDVLSHKLKIGNVQLENKYFKHYGGMSWREQKYNPYDKDTDIDFGGTHPNKVLYDIAQQVKVIYQNETEYLKNINIKGFFKNEK